MAEIILVHGIDQQFKSAQALKAEWLPKLSQGLRAAGYGELADQVWKGTGKPPAITVEMAFYGDQFIIKNQQGAAPGELSAEQVDLMEGLATEWLINIANRSSNSTMKAEAVRLSALIEPRYEEVQGLRSLARGVVANLAKVPGVATVGMAFAERAVNTSLSQVSRYLTDVGVRDFAMASIEKLVTEDTKVIIAHSLGSVVAYEAMHRLNQKIPLLITIGSPLGFRSVIYEKLKPQPPSFPKNLKKWVNIADPNDYVAAQPDLSQDFAKGIPQDSIFEGNQVVNNDIDPHSAEKYLASSKVGLYLAEAFNANLSY